MDDIAKLKEIISLCRRNGLKEFKGSGFELTFHEEFLRKPREAQARDLAVPEEELTDEEVLLWSAVQLPPEI